MSSMARKQMGWVAALAVLPLVAMAGYAVLALPETSDGLLPEVKAHIDQAGAKNPVTAVLLNFRGYDTMLEVGVLLLAVVGARALSGGWSIPKAAVTPTLGPVLLGYVRLAAPVLVITSGYMLWVGGHQPGGAFQAGAILAALGVLLMLCGIGPPAWYRNWLEPFIVVAGLGAFVGVGVLVALGSGHFLEYPPAAAKALILFIEAACTLSIAAILQALFAVGNPALTAEIAAGRSGEGD